MAVAMEFTYRREGQGSFPEMIEAVERTVRSHGFDVIRCHDLQATLAAKGFDIAPLVVFDVCSPATSADLCKMHVYTEGGTVWVSAIRPVALWQEICAAGDETNAEAEASVVSIVDDACAGGAATGRSLSTSRRP
jgi:uncharacterized protein (DUF302 family)